MFLTGQLPLELLKLNGLKKFGFWMTMKQKKKKKTDEKQNTIILYEVERFLSHVYI